MSEKRRQEDQKKKWVDDITRWSGKGPVSMFSLAEDTDGYRRFIHEVVYARLQGAASYR